MSTLPTPALPIARTLLRILVVVNWLGGAAVAVLLVAMPTSRWIRIALKVPPPEDASGVILGLCAIAAIGLVAIPLNYLVLKRLLAMVETVREGDPFVAANARRLETIA